MTPVRPFARRLAEPLAFLLFFATAACWYAWPLPLRLGDAYLCSSPDPPVRWFTDPALLTWMVAWIAHALRTAPLHVFDANIFHPLRSTLALTEHCLGSAPIVLPLSFLTDNALVYHNVFLLASLALTGVATALLIRELGGSALAALVAGGLFAFGPHRTLLLAHVHKIATFAMPLTLLFLHRLLRTGAPRYGIAFAGFLLWQSLLSIYYAYFFTLGVVLYIGLDRLLARRGEPRHHCAALAWLAVAATLLAPTLLPYLDVRDRYAVGRDEGAALMLSPSLTMFLDALLAPVTYVRARYFGDGQWPSAMIGPGTFVLLTASVWHRRHGLRGTRLVLVYAGLAVALVLLSLGPRMRLTDDLTRSSVPGPYAFFALFVPGWSALRGPFNAAIGAFLATSVLAGLGVDALWDYARRHGIGRIAGGLLVLLGVVECWRPPLYAARPPWADESIGAYRWLARQPGEGAVIELPFGAAYLDTRYMVHSTLHWRPLVNGFTGSNPSGPWLANFIHQFPSAPTFDFLRVLGVHYVLLHEASGDEDRCATRAREYPGSILLTYRDDAICIFELLVENDGSPAAPEEVPVALDGARVSASDGADASAALDGDLRTHWVQAIDPRRDGWLQLDLPWAHPVSRIRLRLGRHFGDFPRVLHIETSTDRLTWTPVGSEGLVEPPLRRAAQDPEDLWVDLVIPAEARRHFRFVRPALGTAIVPIGWWPHWGVHEIELYEAPPRAQPAAR